MAVTRQINPDTILEAPDPRSEPLHVPEPVLLYEAYSDHAHVRALKVEDEAVVPELHAGYRILA